MTSSKPPQKDTPTFTSVDDLIARHGGINNVHRSEEELDPNYDRDLIARDAPKTGYYVTTRVVDSMPEPKKEKPPSKVKSFFNSLKSPAQQRVEKIEPSEGKTYHVNEKGQIIETTKIRVAGGAPSWSSWVDGGGGY